MKTDLCRSVSVALLVLAVPGSIHTKPVSLPELISGIVVGIAGGAGMMGFYQRYTNNAALQHQKARQTVHNAVALRTQVQQLLNQINNSQCELLTQANGSRYEYYARLYDRHALHMKRLELEKCITLVEPTLEDLNGTMSARWPSEMAPVVEQARECHAELAQSLMVLQMCSEQMKQVYTLRDVPLEKAEGERPKIELLRQHLNDNGALFMWVTNEFRHCASSKGVVGVPILCALDWFTSSESALQKIRGLLAQHTALVPQDGTVNHRITEITQWIADLHHTKAVLAGSDRMKVEVELHHQRSLDMVEAHAARERAAAERARAEQRKTEAEMEQLKENQRLHDKRIEVAEAERKAKEAEQQLVLAATERLKEEQRLLEKRMQIAEVERKAKEATQKEAQKEAAKRMQEEQPGLSERHKTSEEPTPGESGQPEEEEPGAPAKRPQGAKVETKAYVAEA